MYNGIDTIWKNNDHEYNAEYVPGQKKYDVPTMVGN